ncbi:hypothetical protein P5673_006546 [Acropora cervicornis]|uniref:Uncharacterized protein n=1 Tax=Acropora cervicornis TaxID=6130 RepID=A0AAD9VC41_ACRCE|nr:hypothetical protein P5673_006546 [Acropora cervicornis]
MPGSLITTTGQTSILKGVFLVTTTSDLPLNTDSNLFPDFDGTFLKCPWAIKFSPENREGENSLTRERLSVIVIESRECASVTLPEYPLTRKNSKTQIHVPFPWLNIVNLILNLRFRYPLHPPSLFVVAMGLVYTAEFREPAQAGEKCLATDHRGHQQLLPNALL